jgi:hypothetical protein
MMPGMTKTDTHTDRAVADILTLVDAYRAATGFKDSGVSRAVFSDPGFVLRLRRGEDVKLSKLRRLEAFLRAELAKPRARPTRASGSSSASHDVAPCA